MVVIKLSLDQHLMLAAVPSLLTSPHGLELLGNIAGPYRAALAAGEAPYLEVETGVSALMQGVERVDFLLLQTSRLLGGFIYVKEGLRCPPRWWFKGSSTPAQAAGPCSPATRAQGPAP